MVAGPLNNECKKEKQVLGLLNCYERNNYAAARDRKKMMGSRALDMQQFVT